MEHCRNSTGLIFSSFRYILLHIFGYIVVFMLILSAMAFYV